MKSKNLISFPLASLALAMVACTSEDLVDGNSSTQEAIEFRVGVEKLAGQSSATRADATTSYYAMQAGTQVRLKADGTWTGKEPEAISQTTTCSADAAADNSVVNTLSFTEAEMLYWDDYGSGDPNNSTNTAAGLKVLGVAVDGLSEAPAVTETTQWSTLSWPVVTDGQEVLNADIIVSNNLTTTPYTFANRNDADAQKLVFVHPLSKITINLTAGVGFTLGTVGATNYKFEADPTLTLSNATTLAGISNTDNNYCLTSGTVSIENATATSDGTKAAVVAGTTSTTDASVTVIKQALVYPGTQLGDSDDAVIAVLNADDNIYYIKASEIRTAMTSAGQTDFLTLPGYNYILNVTVNKTGIRVTASVTDWESVTSDEVYPEINVSTTVGTVGSASTDFTTFSFWRSESIDADYQHEATLTGTPDGTTEWTFNTPLYWTHHSQHYHFRGLFPLYDETAATGPVVEVVDSKQVVKVQNGAYAENTFPSNFMMGMPEFGTDDYMCDNEDHTSVDMRLYGICARTSAINLNFRYMMSQVEVNLSTSATTATDYVDLTYAQLELVNVATEGKILLSDRSAVTTNDSIVYSMPSTSSTQYHGIVVPQTLLAGDDSNKVKFKISVYTDATLTERDIYYADVAPILLSDGTTLVAPNGAWESGVHYVYNLKITKTEIKVSASLTDWTTVEAATDVWF